MTTRDEEPRPALGDGMTAFRDPLAAARGLMEAEAARRGITAAQLVGRLARASRRRSTVDIAPRGPRLRRALPQTDTVLPAGAPVFGGTGLSQSSPAARVRNLLTAAGIDFKETVRTDESGTEITEFTGTWPKDDA
jgi:hypothetical protein